MSFFPRGDRLTLLVTRLLFWHGIPVVLKDACLLLLVRILVILENWHHIALFYFKLDILRPLTFGMTIKLVLYDRIFGIFFWTELQNRLSSSSPSTTFRRESIICPSHSCCEIQFLLCSKLSISSLLISISFSLLFLSRTPFPPWFSSLFHFSLPFHLPLSPRIISVLDFHFLQ